jgi:hypothetical protein
VLSVEIGLGQRILPIVLSSLYPTVPPSQAGRPAAWNPGTTAPAWLKGTLPGDYGFDPLQLGKDADKLKWYVCQVGINAT